MSKRLSRETVEMRAMPDRALLELRAALTLEHQKHSSAVAKLSKRLSSIKNELRRRRDTNNLPFVSDHAVLRWLERVKGVDVEGIRAAILKNLPDKDSEGVFDTDGVQFVLTKDRKCVATVITSPKQED